VESGFDPLVLPPDRFFNWIWSLLVKDRNEQQRRDLEIEVYRPLPGQTEVSSGPWSDEEMAASFRAAASQLGS
jgi:hypothetical protein